MVDAGAIKAELQQAINRITAVDEELIETPEKRKRLEGFLREAVGLIRSNKLDQFANLRPVARLRDAADEVEVDLDRLPPEDNAPVGNNRGHVMDDTRRELRRRLIQALPVIPDRVQPPRGGRSKKTRKVSKKRRYSQRR